MEITLTEKYLGTRIDRPVVKIASFPAGFDGTIVGADIQIDFPSELQSSTFNLLINGVKKFTGGARPVIDTGENHVEKTGLAFPVVKTDIISFDVEIIPIGGLTSPLYFSVTIDDGIDIAAVAQESLLEGDNITLTPGAGGDAGKLIIAAVVPENLDDLADVSIVTPDDDDVLTFETASGLWKAKPGGSGGGGISAPTIFSDDFTGGTIDAGKWNTPGAGTSQTGGELVIASASTEHLRSLTTIDFQDKEIQWKMPSPVSNNANVASHIILCATENFSTYYFTMDVNDGLTRANFQGVDARNVTYNATDHLYFKIRSFGKNIWFQTSPDGADWNTQLCVNVSASVYLTGLYYMLRLFNGSGSSKTAKFDDVFIRDLRNVFSV